MRQLALCVWLVVAMTLAAGCGGTRSPRTLEEAIGLHDYDSTLRFCEYYFEHLPAKDSSPGETRRMRDVYRRAFVKWTLQRRGPLTRSAEKRVERFRIYGGTSSGETPSEQ